QTRRNFAQIWSRPNPSRRTDVGGSSMNRVRSSPPVVAGTVRLFRPGERTLWLGSSSAKFTRHLRPEIESVGACMTVGSGGQAMAPGSKKSGGLIVDGKESLHLARRFEAP